MGKLAALGVAFVLVPVLLLGAGAITVLHAVFGTGTGGGLNCSAPGVTASGAAGYGSEQMANAATIVAVGKQMQIPQHGWVVAIATAMTESGLRNLNYGDRDSLGLFQQRPSQGWGSPAQIMDPIYSATKFYQHLIAVDGWQRMSVTTAAQTVQRSGFPDRYANFEQAAREVVGAVHGIPCTTTGTGECATIQAPSAAAVAALNFVCSQRGLPYLWGGDGAAAGGFDCSGLTKAAYAAAGIRLPRTAQTQYQAGPRVPTGQAILPGDLVFFGSGPSAVTHVGIALSADSMVNAPHRGAVVRIERIWRSTFLGVTRPAALGAA
ncbi:MULTISPECIES: C40 family peptidase [unclassified Crossiella]|uniref:C40 family peptidase n=1 Tax=unclassified Crossiella TaxID=2620835 RepID=UPI0020000CFC|nr:MULTISPECIES: C40 family peptidase [unclassified Crossiella]MCK2239775.1 C40 family peptidase [Crossiella sp. S99.2]MCK2252470.1 C40 family peptidase [Crossiella sp. S99.1]